jgi:hypothetical protein
MLFNLIRSKLLHDEGGSRQGKILNRPVLIFLRSSRTVSTAVSHVVPALSADGFHISGFADIEQALRHSGILLPFLLCFSFFLAFLVYNSTSIHCSASWCWPLLNDNRKYKRHLWLDSAC